MEDKVKAETLRVKLNPLLWSTDKESQALQQIGRAVATPSGRWCHVKKVEAIRHQGVVMSYMGVGPLVSVDTAEKLNDKWQVAEDSRQSQRKQKRMLYDRER